MRRQFLRRRKAWLLALVAILATIAAVFLSALASGPGRVALRRCARTGGYRKVVLASGIIKPAVQVSVGAQVSGQLRKLYVRQGERVRKGQLLAEIDPTLQLSDLRNAHGAAGQRQSAKAGLRGHAGAVPQSVGARAGDESRWLRGEQRS
ncbi:macrolide-specific efflux protein MacA [Klebsiella grimontii]|uniref:Macrolide-specific efflux protein MacA n=1 Tax=Klebsiella grimontii TaxID=2058152 RepID=A0A7H4NY03_9ENTR|nr:macrolide-specific efflux protein MacA [Klebsiella grimontii]